MPLHYTIVDGLRVPTRLGGHPALDFCNTFAGWNGGDGGEYLESYAHLVTWARCAGLLEPDRAARLLDEGKRRPAAATAVLEQARTLRDSLYDVLLNGPAAPTFEQVAADVHAAAARLGLRHVEGRIEWDIEEGAGLAAPLIAVAWSAGKLLTSDQSRDVRACPGAGCGWLFLDRRGHRRWCSMAGCGNREKAKRFAARTRAGHG